MINRYKTDIKIYFICKGTSTNNIIDSVNNINKIKKKTFFEELFSTTTDSKKIEKDTFSKLSEIGIKEMTLCKNNNNQLLNSIDYIYTSLEDNAIESCSILFKDNKTRVILPIPYISNNTGIKNNNDIYRLKKEFGEYIINKTSRPVRHYSLIKKYWDQSKIHDNFIEIKNLNISINWEFINNSRPIILNQYNYNKFKQLFLIKDYEILILEHFNTGNNSLSAYVCDEKLLIDFLTSIQFKNGTKYNKNTDIIERSSIWEISINGEIYFDPVSHKIIKSFFIYDSFDKIYPNKTHKKLNYSNNTSIFSYKFNGNKFILFNSLKLIPLEYLKIMTFIRFLNEKKDRIKKLLKSKDNIDNINNYKNNKNSLKNIKLENLQ
jgi:hypothetical protein